MKKLIALFIIMVTGLSTYAQTCTCDDDIIAREHMFCEKCSECNQVIIKDCENIICKGNAFKIVFDCKFWSECAKAGDKINFSVPEAIYTQEGTLLIPACSKVVATVIRIEKQRIPNKNARVYLNFECLVLPDGSAITMNAKPCTKDSSLKEGPWHTAGKLAAWTLGLGIVGAGAGTGFAFIPNPANLALVMQSGFLWVQP